VAIPGEEQECDLEVRRMRTRHKIVIYRVASVPPTAAVWGLLTLAILGVASSHVYASSPGGFSGIAATAQVVTSIATAPSGGFWVQLQDIRSQNAFPDRMDGTYPEFGAPPTTISRAEAILSLTRGRRATS
jgi:hypothetical protein